MMYDEMELIVIFRQIKPTACIYLNCNVKYCITLHLYKLKILPACFLSSKKTVFTRPDTGQLH